jgi:ribosomal protein S18 acetylase RimI-like enzyme
MSAPAIRIRTCRPDDLPALREMTATAFGGVSIDDGIEQTFGPINGRNWRWRKARHVDHDFSRDPAGVFVAEGDGGELVGYASSWFDRDAGIGYIPNLVVGDGHRGKGIGRGLLLHVLSHFRARGLTHARIETLVQNEIGRGLYESIGFREVARQIHFAMEL